MHLFSDNEAMVEFVKGNGVAKGVRHVELRMWYIREQYQKGGMLFEHMKGTDIPVDHLTKLATVQDHVIFCTDIMGLGLLDPDELAWIFDKRDNSCSSNEVSDHAVDSINH